jgi:hypothetical protein
MVAKNSIFGQSVWFGVFLVMSAASAFGFGEKSRSSALPAQDASSATSSSESIWITRPDGAQQCAPGSGQSLEDSAQQLKSAQVHVLNSQKGSDSKMHAQICGIPSGKTNTFQIPKDDLSKASGLGYHQIPSLTQ